MGHIDTVVSKVFCRCARCGAKLNVVDADTDIQEDNRSIETSFIVDPHLCTEYVDDNGTKMKQVKDHNDALQKRNTELVEEIRKLKGMVDGA